MASLRTRLRAARSELRARHWERARELYRQVLEVSPGHEEALHGVGMAMLRSGATDDAIQWLQRATRDNPGSGRLLHGLGQALSNAGQVQEAVRVLEAARGRSPNDIRLQADLERVRQLDALRASPVEPGARLLANGRIEEANAALESVVLRFPRDWRAHGALGQARMEDGRLDEAEEAFRASLALHAHPTTYVHLSDVLSARGKPAEAQDALRDAIRLQPGYGQAWIRLAHIKKFESEVDPDVQQVQSLLGSGAISAVDAEPMHFALGKAYDDLERPVDAFRHLQFANELHKKRQPFDSRMMLQLMDRIEAVCDERFFARCRGWGSTSSVPVFVVGVPRSGSTLVEQIIASHPRAYGVGELRTLARLTADLPSRLGARETFPECLGGLDQDSVAALGAEYLRRLTRDAPSDVLRVCDKMLSNLLLVGMLSVVFPQSTVIHCRRHLMDAGLSMYMQSFDGSAVGYAYDLDHIGQYHARCERLMAHWRRVSPMKVVEVQYERLVGDPGHEVRRLIEATGLAWDERCMQSHRAGRQVRTVSNWQVRKPIHTKSVGRWRAYEEQLATLSKYV